MPGRHPPRAWKEEARHKVEAKLRAAVGGKAFKKTMLSPAETEKEVGKTRYREDFATFVDRGEARPVLANDKTLDNP